MDVTIESHIYYIEIIYKRSRDDTSDVNDLISVYQNDIYIYTFTYLFILRLRIPQDVCEHLENVYERRLRIPRR